MDQPTQLVLLLIALLQSISGVTSTKFTVANKCSYTIWPGIVSNDPLSSTGFVLKTGESRIISAPTSWNGRFWSRTQCTQDSTGNFSCVTGDCGSRKLECQDKGGTPPATLIEFSLGQVQGQDYYDVSLVDGFNVPVAVVPHGGCGECKSTYCLADMISLCPSELRVTSKDGKVVACKGACMADGSSSLQSCVSNPSKPSSSAELFKSVCQRAYSYPADYNQTNFRCKGADYNITFCESPYTNLDTSGSSSCTESITTSHSIKDPKTISSKGGLFTLGFFTPENSTNRYVGIWYMSNSTIVWVANRNRPLRDTSGIVKVSEDGNLVILDGQNQTIWSSNVSNISSTTSFQILDSGNLVLIDNLTKTIWQSFEHPSDTLLQSMKITSNKRTGEKRKLTAWKNQSDPSLGNFSMSLEQQNFAELFIWNATSPYWRSGPWNGQGLTTVLRMSSEYDNGAEEMVFSLSNGSDTKEMVVLNAKGKLLHKQWDDTKRRWLETNLFQNSDCDVYGICGEFGICNSKSTPKCSCLNGFEPRNGEEWNRQNWAGGCVRKSTLPCEKMKNASSNGKEDTFFHLQNVKPPNFGEQSSNTEDDCRIQCLENCTCKAYSYNSVLGCMTWKENLIDVQQFSNGGVDLYIRAANSDLDKKRHRTFIIIIVAVIGTIIISVSCACFLWKWKAKHSGKRNSIEFLSKKRGANVDKTRGNIIGTLSQVKFQELLIYDFEKVATATNNFQLTNKLGQGGFGPVYKGTLQDGQDIAVKRLSRASRQGQEEFMNEMIVISRLQHRNLVKLLGCCIEEEEKMLIYEYMPNKSLDAFIFDPEKRKLLDWEKRFVIIEGIARGVLYLHKDSRLKIIHRDLKASNILLDENLIPKISDFGMARIFKGSEDHANTRRVVGTYGYMSPEYAMEGLFSEKSDVFSFGVLLLEIISGRRNSSFYNNEQSLSLLGFAWKLWNEGNIVQLIDPEISNQKLEKDILRCIHIGLLCVQDLAIERPSMSTVVSMLNSEIVNLPPPRQPAFIQWQSILNQLTPEENQRLFSNNELSVSDIQGR
ncbi:G-type lectin S-receptor-like serine/threonine-protein kinase At1g11330 isoform X2 [Neltuma alba]|uniref:G-type lectin S-receptor-like serine/threonine-protein kinase At1g11330 isoform X2 n=1 Tax=Neltuma alba TaxID=207710 RepID=UPI0010A2ED2D|nr:G-type lectin S-receptor-like serine/threonine-protein kinase At1g11330 isoform X2 [Prosopis alba]